MITKGVQKEQLKYQILSLSGTSQFDDLGQGNTYYIYDAPHDLTGIDGILISYGIKSETNGQNVYIAFQQGSTDMQTTQTSADTFQYGSTREDTSAMSGVRDISCYITQQGTGDVILSGVNMVLVKNAPP